MKDEKDKIHEEISDNRVFMGSDAPIDNITAHNIMDSPEYRKYNLNQIENELKDFKVETDSERHRNMSVCISLLKHRDKRVEQMFKDVLNARLDGYSIRQIAHAMKVKRSIVERIEEEAKYEVQVALSKRKILPAF